MDVGVRVGGMLVSHVRLPWAQFWHNAQNLGSREPEPRSFGILFLPYVDVYLKSELILEKGHGVTEGLHHTMLLCMRDKSSSHARQMSSEPRNTSRVLLRTVVNNSSMVEMACESNVLMGRSGMKYLRERRNLDLHIYPKWL